MDMRHLINLVESVQIVDEETLHGDAFFEKYGWLDYNDSLMEADYRGKKVSLNSPVRTPNGPKKFSVYTKNAKGNIVKVNFGDPNMSIKRRYPKHRKSYRARHHCDTNPGPKWKANYWSCRNW